MAKAAQGSSQAKQGAAPAEVSPEKEVAEGVKVGDVVRYHFMTNGPSPASQPAEVVGLVEGGAVEVRVTNRKQPLTLRPMDMQSGVCPYFTRMPVTPKKA